MGKRWGYCSLGKSGNLRGLLICPIAGATATSLIEGSPAGKPELAVDPGLQDGGVVEVVNRGSNNRERGALLIFSSWKSLIPQSKREN
jgi:hypothetical protein